MRCQAHQSIHQTPCRRNTPTPATQKSSGQRGGPRTPKRTSDPVQMQQVPRLPRKSPAASAAARAHQSVHQTPRRRLAVVAWGPGVPFEKSKHKNQNYLEHISFKCAFHYKNRNRKLNLVGKYLILKINVNIVHSNLNT